MTSERGQVENLLAAGEQLLCKVLVLLSAPHHRVLQQPRLKPWPEGGPHGRICGHERPSLNPWENEG